MGRSCSVRWMFERQGRGQRSWLRPNAWGGLDTVINFAGLCARECARRDSAADRFPHRCDGEGSDAWDHCRRPRLPNAEGRCARWPWRSYRQRFLPWRRGSGVRVSLYQSAKAGCRTFSLGAAKDLARHGIVVSVLMPDAVATPMADLQLLHDESAMAYSGGILTLDQLTCCLLHNVLPYRPMEKRLGASLTRQWGAAFADCFPSSRAIQWTEDKMRRAGRAAQARECERRLAGDSPRDITPQVREASRSD